MAEARREHSPERRRRDWQTALRLRDSLSYRADALRWHARLLRTLTRSAEARLDAKFPDQSAAFDVLWLASLEHQWIFDDLVFNALAAFDYMANFIAFAYYGDKRRKAKWDRVQKYARDSSHERSQNGASRVAAGPVGPVVNELHQSLLVGLSDYRAELIHYQAIAGVGTVRTRLVGKPSKGVTHNFNMRAPPRFLDQVQKALPTEDQSLLAAADWLVHQSEKGLYLALRELERDLRAEGGFDPDGTERIVVMV